MPVRLFHTHLIPYCYIQSFQVYLTLSLSSTLAHNSIVKKAHEACDIAIWKTTHGGRTSAGVDMGLANVEEGEKKAMGLWQRDSFNSCYGTNIATQGVSALAGADPQYIRATYWTARFDLGEQLTL